jgi:hypothetical protein
MRSRITAAATRTSYGRDGPVRNGSASGTATSSTVAGEGISTNASRENLE